MVWTYYEKKLFRDSENFNGNECRIKERERKSKTKNR